MRPIPKSCYSCGVPLAAIDARTAPLCGQLHCRWRYDAVPAYRRCAICARPLSDHAMSGRVCAGGDCEREWAIERPRRRQREIEAEAVALRATHGPRAGVDAPSDFPVATVPSARARVTRLPARRRRAVREGFAALIATVVAQRARGERPAPDEPLPASRTDVDSVLGHMCGRCRGVCCATGRDHAWATEATFHSYLDAHPDRDADAVLAAYMERLPRRSVDRSCVFHRSDGCALPRDMRADKCNRYLCDSLTDFARATPPGVTPRAFVVAVHGLGKCDATLDHIAFVDARDVRAAHRVRSARPPSP